MPIDVLLPTNNASSMVRAALISILNQRGVSARVIVVDDTRDKSTSQDLARICAEFANVIIVPNQGSGLPDALNSGLREVRTDYCARMDADDVSLPERLRLQAAWLDSHPDCVLVGGFVRYFDTDDRLMDPIDWEGLGIPIESDSLKRALIDHNCIFHPTAMFRTDAVRSVGGYRHDFPHNEDYDLWIRLTSQGSMHNLPFPVLLYRLHDAQVGRIFAVEQELSRGQLLGALSQEIVFDKRLSAPVIRQVTLEPAKFAAVLVVHNTQMLTTALGEIAEQVDSQLQDLLIVGNFSRFQPVRVRQDVQALVGPTPTITLARWEDAGNCLAEWTSRLSDSLSVFFFDSRDASDRHRVRNQVAGLDAGTESWCVGQVSLNGIPRSSLYPSEYLLRSSASSMVHPQAFFRSNVAVRAAALNATARTSATSGDETLLTSLIDLVNFDDLVELPFEVASVRIDCLSPSAKVTYRSSRLWHALRPRLARMRHALTAATSL